MIVFNTLARILIFFVKLLLILNHINIFDYHVNIINGKCS